MDCTCLKNSVEEKLVAPFTTESIKDCIIEMCTCEDRNGELQPTPVIVPRISPAIDAKPFQEPLQIIVDRVNKQCDGGPPFECSCFNVGLPLKEFTLEHFTMKGCRRIRACRCEERGDWNFAFAAPLGLQIAGPIVPSAPKIAAKPVQEPIQNLVERVNKRCPRQVTRLESPVGK